MGAAPAAPGQRVEPLELEDLPGPVQVPQPAAVESYDIDREREGWRGVIALWLLGLLTAVVIFAFAIFWYEPDKVTALKDLLSIIFGPIVTLVGAATGYYFGASTAKGASR
jgi:hypothetical protein